jgi:glycosyltransferase involved in cell wall biosynthesis
MTSRLRNRRIGMDDRMLAGDGTGVATYARALRAAQAAIAADALLIGADGRPRSRAMKMAAAAMPGTSRLRGTDGTPARLVARDLFRTAHVHFGLYRRFLALRAPGPPGLVHWTYPLPLRVIGWDNLYTVHDTIPLTHPDLTPIDTTRHRRVLAEVVRHAARIVTVSQAARAGIVAATGCAPEQVVDLSQPVDVEARRAGPLPRGLEPGGYLLVVGAIEPRKNIARILEAYRASGLALPLVLAGPDGWNAAPLVATIAQTPGAIRLAGLDRATLLALIAGARALLMPSLAEGFGLPVAEAITLGTPVLTAHDGALAETAGAAALRVDPLDVGAIAQGMVRIATDDALRAALAAAAATEARRFTPAGFAQRLAALYDEVASPRHAAYPAPRLEGHA